ncbi:MAG: efflux RND transporter periplasmic adaptor subunit [bacterium]
MKKSRIFWEFVIIAVVVTTGAFLGCERAASNSPEDKLLTNTNAPPPEEKPTYTVERGTVTKKIQFLSRVAPIDERNLFFRTDGRVKSVLVKEGDWVKAGDVLAELEMTDLLNQVAQAKVNLEKAQMRLAEVEANTLAIAEAEAKLAISQIRLEQTRSQDPSAQVTIAKANLDKAALALEAARINDRMYSRQEPSHQLREATLNYQIAEANYNLALQNLESHRYQLKILEEEVKLAKVDLQKLKEYKDPQAVTDVKLAELALKRLEDQADMHRITSPIDGQVMSISVYPGNEAKAFHPVIIVADPSTFEISADLMSTEVIQLHIGQEAMIELVDHPGQVFKGQVRRLPYGGQSGTEFLENADRSTRIQFDPPKSLALEVGDLARATIVLEEKKDVLYLPPEAVRVYQGRRFIVVQDGDRRRRVDVKLGLQGEDRVEIEEGAKEGQIVIGQ